MTCQERDQDLLLASVGELPFWRRHQVALHVRACRRCRRRQSELANTSRRIAGVLAPPPARGGPGRGPGTPVRMRPGWFGLSPLFVALVLGLFVVTAVTVWYTRSHMQPGLARLDPGCLPGLPSDRCR